MSLFDFFRRKKPNPPQLSIEELSEQLFGKRDNTDYLGQAAAAGTEGRAAIQEKRFNDAWKSFHLQKQHYMGHASRSGFTPAQTIALDGSVHEDLANVRRLEGKHQHALVHLMYCVATSPRPTKAQEKKLIAYLNRAKLAGASVEDFREFMQEIKRKPDFVAIRSAVASWNDKD